MDDFASSFMIDFMAFKYGLPHDYITHECEITCDKCDNVISKNTIDFNKEHENEYIKSYGYFENDDNIELGDIRIYKCEENFKNSRICNLGYYMYGRIWKIIRFDRFIKELQLGVNVKKQNEKVKLVIESISKKQNEKLQPIVESKFNKQE